MSESFAALFEESLQRTEMRSGEVITAEVVRVEHNFVVVNAGLKSEAYVPIDEFKNDQGEVEVQPGDFVSVAIGSIENGYGDTILSRDTAKRLASWLALEQALESGDFVTGTTTGKVKGGLTVMVNGIRAFLPGSLIDTRPTKDLTPYENKTMEFKVIKLDRKRKSPGFITMFTGSLANSFGSTPWGRRKRIIAADARSARIAATKKQ